mmetsp:Transcript_24796/g.35489  ORF Transcript_24796/g.35489 Transcript_24796/m.35489 type:complete len:201 (-) Transcript_24796:70-672(-)
MGCSLDSFSAETSAADKSFANFPSSSCSSSPSPLGRPPFNTKGPVNVSSSELRPRMTSLHSSTNISISASLVSHGSISDRLSRTASFRRSSLSMRSRSETSSSDWSVNFFISSGSILFLTDDSTLFLRSLSISRPPENHDDIFSYYCYRRLCFICLCFLCFNSAANESFILSIGLLWNRTPNLLRSSGELWLKNFCYILS